MKAVTVAQMRELDRRTIEEFGTPGEELMDRAGLGVADAVCRASEFAGGYGWPVRLFAGKGNNGGDVFAAARYLKERGLSVDVWLAARKDEVKGDALAHLKLMQAAGVPLRELPSEQDWVALSGESFTPGVLVDGLLGTGASGAPRGAVAGAIALLNHWAENALVVAIDIPSGVHGDTGAAEGVAVIADVTVTMALPKRGLLEPAAVPYVGNVEMVDIGIPDEYVTTIEWEDDRELLSADSLRSLVPRRALDSHKGHYGHVLLLGGARGYAGAIAMAARAAVRSGAGLVSVWVPKSIASVVAGAALEAMVKGVEETDTGSLLTQVLSNAEDELDDYRAVLVGPGLTRCSESKDLVGELVKRSRVPLVVDADAISVFEGDAAFFREAECPVVLTPHPGELARLLGKTAGEIQANRYAAAAEAASVTGATVILKGAGTIVASKGQPLSINVTGNPGMATGGSGDVLAGLLVGLLGQGLDPCSAAKLAVYLHGRAGDYAAAHGAQACIAATDLIAEIPAAFRDVSFR